MHREYAMTRYTFVSSITGAIDFLIALVFLHLGFSATFSLAVSIAFAGIVDYLALEWWGFPGRKSRFSCRRLAASAGVELGTYLIRMGVLLVWNTHLNDIDPTDHLIGLAAAYGIAFVFGYLVRNAFVFGKMD